MNPRPVALAAAVLAVLLLLGSCAPGGDTGPQGAMPAVGGEPGGRPVLDFPDSGPPQGFATEVVEPGHGAVVHHDDLVLVRHLAQAWDGPEVDSSYGDGSPVVASLPGLPTGWSEALTGLRVGSRVLLSVPPEIGYAPPGGAAVAAADDEVIILVVDVVGAYGRSAGGDADARPDMAAAGAVAPRVSGALGGPASVTVPPGSPPPTTVVTTVLARGAGPSVSPGPVIVQYAAVDWDGASAASSWESGAPEQFLVSPADPAFAGLAGVPIGSRVLVELPGEGAGSPATAIVMDLVGQP